MLKCCGHFIQSGHQSKHHPEFTSCLWALIPKVMTKSLKLAKWLVYGHIFLAKNRAWDSWFNLWFIFHCNTTVPKGHQSYHPHHKKLFPRHLLHSRLFLSEWHLKIQPTPLVCHPFNNCADFLLYFKSEMLWLVYKQIINSLMGPEISYKISILIKWNLNLNELSTQREILFSHGTE